MPFPVPGQYSSEAADIARDEAKRRSSPPSFFYAQTRGLLLAATYFRDARLQVAAYSAVARKHRHRIQYAAFGQVMAAFEFCLKDFVAQVLDATDLYDEQIESARWIEIDKSRILSLRRSVATVGAILIHPLLGWQDPEEVNSRYRALFGQDLLRSGQADTLKRLWILRHTVAHNAGFLTHHDAYRMRAPHLGEKSISVDAAFLAETVEFLRTVVSGMSDPIGTAVIRRWMRDGAIGDYNQDRETYIRLKTITTYVPSRAEELPTYSEADYAADRAAIAPPTV